MTDIVICVTIKLNNRLVEVGENHLSKAVREEARERILRAAMELFAQKGYDGTRINEIAEMAEVNKALIYYYFDNKQAILDSLLTSVMKQLADISMEFVHDCVIPMIDDGRLDIIKNQFHFASAEAQQRFRSEMLEHYAKAIDYMLNNRLVIRIMMLESLKDGKHQFSLFRFLELLEKRPENIIYQTIRDADPDYDYAEDTVFFRFFFSLIPLVSIAAYYDDYKERSMLNDEAMLDMILKGIELFNVHTYYDYLAGKKG